MCDDGETDINVRACAVMMVGHRYVCACDDCIVIHYCVPISASTL